MAYVPETTDEAAPFMIDQHSPHRWRLLMLKRWEDGTLCYEPPFPAASNCVNRQEAEAYMRRCITDDYDGTRGAFEEPTPMFTARYDAAGNLMSEDGEPTIPVCQPGHSSTGRE